MSISTERLTEWIKLRVKELEDLNKIRDGINQLTCYSQSPEIQQATSLLKALILEKKLVIKEKMDRTRDQLNLPNCGRSHEPSNLFGREDK